jgi:hypothetical protein
MMMMSRDATMMRAATMRDATMSAMLFYFILFILPDATPLRHLSPCFISFYYLSPFYLSPPLSPFIRDFTRRHFHLSPFIHYRHFMPRDYRHSPDYVDAIATPTPFYLSPRLFIYAYLSFIYFIYLFYFAILFIHYLFILIYSYFIYFISIDDAMPFILIAIFCDDAYRRPFIYSFRHAHADATFILFYLFYSPHHATPR